MTLYSKHTRALTFENWCQVQQTCKMLAAIGALDSRFRRLSLLVKWWAIKSKKKIYQTQKQCKKVKGRELKINYEKQKKK